jgi:hypothetical protein
MCSPIIKTAFLHACLSDDHHDYMPARKPLLAGLAGPSRPFVHTHACFQGLVHTHARTPIINTACLHALPRAL